MSQLILTREQVRSVDRIAIQHYGMPGIVLMENAGRGCAELLLQHQFSGPICICCGKGNNGGDGFVIARHLENHGIPVDVCLFADPSKLPGDAAINWNVLQQAQTNVSVNPALRDFAEKLQGASWVVDALFGTGLQDAIRAPYIDVIEFINAANKPVLAVDIPSGIDCDSGEILGCCVNAKMTATFVASKPAFQLSKTQLYTGEIHVIDIGVPNLLLTSLMKA